MSEQPVYMRLRAVPEPLLWIVLVQVGGRTVREMIVGRDVAPTEGEAIDHAERCLRGEIAERLWSPPKP